MNAARIKVLEEKIVSTLQDISVRTNILNQTSVAQELRSTVDKWDLIKLKGFCTAKETTNQERGSPQNGRKSSPVIPLTAD